MRNILCLMVLALLAAPALAPADKKDDQLLEISRDIGDLSERVRDLQKSQAAQAKDIEALHALIQQAAAASAQVSQDMAALEKSLTSAVAASLTDQQSKISQAILTPLGARMDALAANGDQLNATIGALNERIGKMEKKLSDVSDKVSTINQPPPALPPSPVPVPAAAPDTSANGVPAGVSKPGLQEAATRDYQGGNDDLALTELSDYVKYWPDDSWAPTAGYVMGMIYMRGKDYESATEAFQKVIDTYPENNQAQNALFQKGMALELWPGHKTEAIATLKDFVNKYAVNDNVPKANAEIKKLTTPSGAGRGRGRGAAR